MLLATRLALGVAYSVIVPMWEGYDEDSHFAFARYVAARGVLPQPGDPQAEQIWEKFQPPLYYLLIAIAIAPFESGEIQPAYKRNPYVAFGDAGVNYAIHPEHLTGSAQTTAWAALAARLVGVLISTASVLPVYWAARRLWPSEPGAAWTAASLYAFWPQSMYVGSVITNDVLVVALSAWLFWIVAWLAHTGPRPALLAGTGAFLGGALLAKLNALGLIPMAAAGLLIALRPLSRSRRPWAALTFLAMGGIALLAWLGSQEFIVAHLAQPQTLVDFWHSVNPGGAGLARPEFLLPALRHGFRSMVAAFGRGNLEAPELVYGLWSLGIGLAAAGLALNSRQGRRPHVILSLAGWQVGGLAALYFGLALSQQNALLPGRYLMPALPGIVVLMTAGWRGLVPGRWGQGLQKATAVGSVLASWALLFLVIAPAYAKPLPLAAGIAIDQPLGVVFGGQVELLGHQRLKPLAPGRPYTATLCWQATGVERRDYSVLLEIQGPAGETYGRLETYPGHGNFPTSLWPALKPFCDEYLIRINDYANSPATLQVSLLDGYRGEPVRAHTAGDAWASSSVRIPIPVED